jgi:hypothetical protein
MRYLLVLLIIAIVAAGCSDIKTRCVDDQLKTLSFRSPDVIKDTIVRYTVYKKGTDFLQDLDSATVKVVATHSGEYVLPVSIKQAFMYFHHYDWAFKLYPSGRQYDLTEITFHERREKQYDGHDCVNDMSMKVNGVLKEYPGKDKYEPDDNYSISY